MMTISATMSTPNPTPSTLTPTPPPSGPSSLPLRTVPGSYGLPILGPIGDRLNYFWFQGQDTFFRKKMEKHNSSVFRTNVPPCFPFFVGVNPNVIAVLDVPSFSHLFDMDIIEKKNVLVGDFMPSLKFTGNMRVGVYLDTTEEHHAKASSLVGVDPRASSSSLEDGCKKLVLSRQEVLGVNSFYLHEFGLGRGHCCIALVDT